MGGPFVGRTKGKKRFDSGVSIGALGVDDGTNKSSGLATLVAGTLVVANTRVTADSRIQLTTQAAGAGTEGFVIVSTRTPGTSFTILSSEVSDVSTVAWLIIEPDE